MQVKTPESFLTSSEGVIEQSINNDPENGSKTKTKQVSRSGDSFSVDPLNFDKKVTFRTQSFENKKKESFLAKGNDEGYEGGHPPSNSESSANNNN